jgi:hypothetical protein
VIARLYPRRPRRFSPPSTRPSVGPLDGGVRSTGYNPPLTFDQQIRSASRAARAPFAPSVRPPKLPAHLRRPLQLDDVVRARASRVRQRSEDERTLVVPEHVADALRSRLSA